MIKILLTAISLCAKDTSQLPPLHTLKDKDIVVVSSSFENQTITVGLKNDTMYVYDRIDWDYEDHFSSTPDRIKKAISSIRMTFTKAEVPPQFAGGDSAWVGYIQAFCEKHRQTIGNGPPVEITVQFIVHMKGQVDDVTVVENPAKAGSDMTRLAVEAIKEAPAWVPAHQHGRAVICYKKQLVRLGL